MKTRIMLFVGYLIISSLQPALTQTVIGFDAFTTSTYYPSPLTFTEDAIPFTLTDTGGEAGYEFRSMSDYAGELEMGDNGGSGATIKITLTHRDGWVFDLNSIDLMALINAPDWIIKGYRSSSQVSGSPVTFSLPVGGPSYTRINTNFQQVDMVTIEENPVYEGGFNIWCDQFVVDNINDPSLPVELSSFSALCINNTVLVEWITESENNNLGFIIERSEGDIWRQIVSYQTDFALKGQGISSGKTRYRYIDKNVKAGKKYTYRLSDVNDQGVSTVKALVSVTMESLPQVTELIQAYPNPFNPQTVITYRLAENLNVNISVYDIAGRLVKTLFDANQLAGTHHVHWYGRDDRDIKCASGNYFIVMQTEKSRYIQKLLLVK
ncbi:MAG TPA: T9SS type A sorting domain-containing protein [bacterium]|nr:T9SS type A sorting domain-containing protein [bacterium]HPN45123.1 T9SS type A sorting domain-containing protein [bacterium]